MPEPNHSAVPDIMVLLALGGEPTPAEIAAEIRDTYNRYVIFHSDYAEAESGFMALWTMSTYVYQAFPYTGYPLITAPTSEAGKSRVFDVARCLVHKPFVVVDPTGPSLFRIIDELHPTLLVDEADMLKESKGLRQVLNSGFQPGTPVIRANGTYDVFCPKAFSGIAGDRPPVTKATASRCVPVPMRRRMPSEVIARFRLNAVMRECEPIREAMKNWGKKNFDLLADMIPEMPDGLSDRQQNSWEAIFAIADHLGEPWAGDARHWALILSSTVTQAIDPNVQLLSDVKRVLDMWPGRRIPTDTLMKLRENLDDRDFPEKLSSRSLGRRLGALGIHPAPQWREQDGSFKRGFDVRDKGEYLPVWIEAFTRYALIDGSSEADDDTNDTNDSQEVQQVLFDTEAT